MSDDNEFRMTPTSEAELKEMTDTPLEFIARKLKEAELHIPNVHEVKQICDAQELDEAGYHMVLAYRAITSMVQVQETAATAVNEAQFEKIIHPSGELVLPK